MSTKDLSLAKTAKECNIREDKLQEIVNTFFEVVSNDIETKKFRGSYLRRLGKFVIKPKRLEKLNSEEGFSQKQPLKEINIVDKLTKPKRSYTKRKTKK